MLAAFLEMKKPVLEFLDRSSNGLSDLVLDEEEWEAIEGLVSALKVRYHSLFFSVIDFRSTDPKRCDTVLLFEFAKYSCCHPRYGRY